MDALVVSVVAVAVVAVVESWLPGKSSRSTPKDEPTTPDITLFAEPAIASTCCSTRSRRLPVPSCGNVGESDVMGVRFIGIGVKAAALVYVCLNQ